MGGRSKISLMESISKIQYENTCELFEVFKTLEERGCKVMLNNSYSEFILDLYKDYRINTLRAKRAINSNPNNRGEIKELLF